MNRCFDANNDGNCQGNEFQFVPCAKNFVILMTDGQWNRVEALYNTRCKIDDDWLGNESPDPVVPAYYMHKTGFTNSASGTSVTSYIESVYTVGLWLERYRRAGFKEYSHVWFF